MKRINEIGAFEAKSRLSELLRETERGQSFLILRRDKAVARLVPPEDVEKTDPLMIISALQTIRDRVPGKIKIKKMVKEGRRY